MQEADLIAIPLLDGRQALAQIARIENGKALLLISDWSRNADSPIDPLPAGAIMASAVVTLSEVAPGQWPVLGYDAVPRITQYVDLDLSGADPTDPAIVEAFVNALFGLYPWDGFPDPAFFNAFLRNPDATPKTARMAASFPSPEEG